MIDLSAQRMGLGPRLYDNSENKPLLNGTLAGVGERKFWIRLARVAPLLGILMGVRLFREASVQIAAFGGTLALVHRPPWPFTRLDKHRLC